MLGKIYSAIVNLVLVFAFLVGILVVLSTLSPSDKYKLFTVQSGSMEPAIKTGSVIFTKKQNDYQVGDIVTRETSDGEIPVTHRIVREENELFVTKGDANDGDDRDEFSKEKVIGKVYLKIPYLGYPVSFAKTSHGFILIIVIPAVILIYEELRKIKKEIKKKFEYRKRDKTRQENKEKESTKEDDEEKEI